MKLYDLTITEFLDQVDSATPTPGGGSVSALTIAKGISLVRMVGHLTIPKKKFQELDEAIKLDYMSRISALDEIKVQMIQLIDKDTAAFNKIIAAFRMPKDTSIEKQARNKAINEGTIEATEVPLQGAKLALKALELAEPTLKYANKTALSDFGVGVHLILAGLHGCVLNVKTNMHSYHDKELSNKYYDEVKSIEEKAKKIASSLLKVVNQEFA